MTQQLAVSLDKCLETLRSPPQTSTLSGTGADPTAATSAALISWGSACEQWLWDAAGNKGNVPNKFAGRCGLPRRSIVPRPRPGKDGAVIPPRTAVAAGILRRLLELQRILARAAAAGDSAELPTEVRAPAAGHAEDHMAVPTTSRPGNRMALRPGPGEELATG